MNPSDDAPNDGRRHFTVMLRLAWRASTLEQFLERAEQLGLGVTSAQWFMVWTSPQGEQLDRLIPRL